MPMLPLVGDADPFVAHLTAPPATSCRELYQALLQISPTCACAQPLHLASVLLLSHHHIGHIFGTASAPA